jgi:hypothetical protein
MKYSVLGWSINDVTALGGRRYQGFCDNSTKASLLNCMTIGGGSIKNYQKLCEVIYGRPLSYYSKFVIFFVENVATYCIFNLIS